MGLESSHSPLESFAKWVLLLLPRGWSVIYQTSMRCCLPRLSPEAQAFVKSILGHLPSEISLAEITSEQAEQLLIVLEEELNHDSRKDEATNAVRRREIAELASALIRSKRSVIVRP